MPSTTIRVSTATRDAVKQLAEAADRTLDEQIAVMTRRARQRQMGEQLAAAELADSDRVIIDGGVSTVDASFG